MEYQEIEEIECETVPEDFLRNGLGDDSFYLWPNKKIPYVIGEGFNETNRANIIGNDQFSKAERGRPKSDRAKRL